VWREFGRHDEAIRGRRAVEGMGHKWLGL
jgi:hypothetical protein